MGLDTSHEAFHGAYSAFNRLRQAVAKAAGGSFPPHSDPAKFPRDDMWYWTDDNHGPGLYEFMTHSDCDGEISPEMCNAVADELEALLPKMQDLGEAGGHLARVGGYHGALTKFIAGCRLAAECNEPLEFW